MPYKLFFLLIGCRLPGRHTEQHDVFFGIGKTPADLAPAIREFWPQGEILHVDCWREVTSVNGYKVAVSLREESDTKDDLSLYFINLGGYKKGEFEEFHYRDIFAAPSQDIAIKLSKKTPFFRQYGFKGAVSHVDDKYGVDVDEVYPVEEILSPSDKQRYKITVTNELAGWQDEINLGYIPIEKLK